MSRRAIITFEQVFVAWYRAVIDKIKICWQLRHFTYPTYLFPFYRIIEYKTKLIFKHVETIRFLSINIGR